MLVFTKKYFTSDGILKDEYILNFHRILGDMPTAGHELRCYYDVLAFISEHQDAEHRRTIVAKHFKDGIDSPIFKSTLNTDLYPYQREGAVFAVRVGRCLIGDDMGLGKTIQALAASELMAKLFSIRKALIVSPTSLKYQWKTEIEKFSSRSAEVVEGYSGQRQKLYKNDSFYQRLPEHSEC